MAAGLRASAKALGHPPAPNVGAPVLDPTDKAITRILETYKSAVYAKDAVALIRLYDPKARVFDTWGVWSYEGSGSWQSAVEAWFSSLGTERVKVSFP